MIVQATRSTSSTSRGQRSSSSRTLGCRNDIVLRSATQQQRKAIVCNYVATDGNKAWEAWTEYMCNRPKVTPPTDEELKIYSAIGSAISASAATLTPKYVGRKETAEQFAEYKQKHVTASVSIPPSADMHEKLEAMGLTQLKLAMGLPDDAELDVATTSFTTTDINAGILVTGCIQQRGADKVAVVAFVAAETERQASWSRLEGLLLHWGCSPNPADAWHMPPIGWKAVRPNKTADAGGAVQCAFDKITLPGAQENMYVLVLELPVRGILRSGGISFVLKASNAQNTKWLQNAGNRKDFFVDLQNLPFAKV